VRPTDVEISRSLNALSTTLRDQRPASFDPARVEQILTGALAGERKLAAHSTGPDSGELRIRDDGALVALVRLREGQWAVERKLRAAGSTWALPQPAYSEHDPDAQDEGGCS
jgi:hypothetical protein